MKKEREVTQEAFDNLLTWLDADRDRAGVKYETIRRRLIRIFTCRSCIDAEDLADETINRVITKVADISRSYSGDPALYFYGVAQKVHLEYLRQSHPRQAPVPVIAVDDEQEYKCLEECLAKIPTEARQLVIEYYQDVKRAKIDHRRKLAEQLGIAVNALRIRAHRVRSQLHQCVTNCLEAKPAN